MASARLIMVSEEYGFLVNEGAPPSAFRHEEQSLCSRYLGERAFRDMRARLVREGAELINAPHETTQTLELAQEMECHLFPSTRRGRTRG